MKQFKWLGTNRLSQVLKDWVQNDGGYETIGSLYCTTYDFSPELSFENWFVSRKWLHLQWILWHFAFSMYFKSCSVVNYSQLKVFIASKFNFFFCGIARYTIRIYCTFRKQATEEEYFTFWWVKLICCCWTFSKFQDVIKHVDFKRPKKGLYGSFGALSYLDVIRKWPSQGGVLRRNVNLGRNEKLGSLEISIVRKFASPMSFGS